VASERGARKSPSSSDRLNLCLSVPASGSGANGRRQFDFENIERRILAECVKGASSVSDGAAPVAGEGTCDWNGGKRWSDHDAAVPVD